MLAGLSGLITRLRKLAPPSGVQYRTFNISVLVWVLVGCIYILGQPRRSTVAAWLGNGQTIGAAVVVALCFLATVLSYRYATTGAALGIVVTACLIWMVFLVIGIANMFTWPGLGFVVLFGFLARDAYVLAEDE